MEIKKKFCLIIIMGLLGLIDKANAQTDTTKNNVFGAFLIMPIEFPVIDTKGINEQLTANGFAPANYSTANIGIGLQVYANRFITTLSFNKTTKKDNNDSYLAEVEYRSTSLNVGYSLTKSKWFSIYPYVGFKGSGPGKPITKCFCNGGVQCKLKVLSSFSVWSRWTVLYFKSPPLQKHKTLWASLKNDSDTADRHENRQHFFPTELDCLENILILQDKRGDQQPFKKTGRHRTAKRVGN